MYIDKQNNSVFIMSKLNQLKNSLDRDTINLEQLRREMKQISDLKEVEDYSYMKDLLDPFNRKGGKIPTDKPIPSCTFQIHNSITFRCNLLGNDFFGLNPFFLASSDMYAKEFYLGATKQYIGTSAGMYFISSTDDMDGKREGFLNAAPTSFNVCIPNVYNKYRVVSAGLTLKYVGPLEAAQGVMGGGIAYQKSNYVGVKYGDNMAYRTNSSTNPDLYKYTNFENIRQCVYFQENSCLEGLKMIYFPLDNSFNEFKKVWDGGGIKKAEKTPDYGTNYAQVQISDDYFGNGFYWVGYIENGTYIGNSQVFRLDYYINY